MGSIAFDFARWFQEKFIGNDGIDFGSREFRATMGKAKRLFNEGYDPELVKRTLRTMRDNGVEGIDTPYAVKWRIGSQSWYEFSTPQMPPMWDAIAKGLYESGETPIRVISR